MTPRRSSHTTSANGSASGNLSSRNASSRRSSMNDVATRQQNGTNTPSFGEDEQRYPKRRRTSTDSKTPSHSSQGSQNGSSSKSKRSTRSSGTLPPIDETPIQPRRSKRLSDTSIEDAPSNDQTTEHEQHVTEDGSPVAKRRKLSTSSRRSSATSRNSGSVKNAASNIEDSPQKPNGHDVSDAAAVSAASPENNAASPASSRTSTQSQPRRSQRLSHSSHETSGSQQASVVAEEVHEADDDDDAAAEEHDSHEGAEQFTQESEQIQPAQESLTQSERQTTPISAAVSQAQLSPHQPGDADDGNEDEDEDAEEDPEDSNEAAEADGEEQDEDAEGEIEGNDDAEDDADDAEEAQEAPAGPLAQVITGKAKPVKKLPGRRRAQNPNPKIEAAMRRQLHLRMTYRAVAKQLRPILAEISKRTVKNLERDPLLHTKASESEKVIAQLGGFRKRRLDRVDLEHELNKKNFQRIFEQESELRRMRFEAHAQDIKDRFLIKLQHDFLMTVRKAQMEDDGHASDDEGDDVIPSVRHVDVRGNLCGVLGSEYHWRSRPAIETERLISELEARRGLYREVEGFDEEEAAQDPRPFTNLDPTHREGLDHDHRVECLVEALSEAAKEPPKPPTPPPIISNEDAVGLQVLASAMEGHPDTAPQSSKPVVKQRESSSVERKVPASPRERMSSEQRPSPRAVHAAAPRSSEMPDLRRHEQQYGQQYIYGQPGPTPLYWDPRGPPPQGHEPPPQHLPQGSSGPPPLTIKPSIAAQHRGSEERTPIKTHFSSSPPIYAPQHPGMPPYSHMTPYSAPPPPIALPPNMQPPQHLPQSHEPSSYGRDTAGIKSEASARSSQQKDVTGKTKLLPKPTARPPSPPKQSNHSRRPSTHEPRRPDWEIPRPDYRPLEMLHGGRPSQRPSVTSESSASRARSASETFGPLLNPEARPGSPASSRPPALQQSTFDAWRFRGQDPFRRSTVSSAGGPPHFQHSSQHPSPSTHQSTPLLPGASMPPSQHLPAPSPTESRHQPQLLPRVPHGAPPFGVPPPPMPYHQPVYQPGSRGLPPPPLSGGYPPHPSPYSSSLPPPPLPPPSSGPPSHYPQSQQYGSGPPLLPAHGHGTQSDGRAGSHGGGHSAASPQQSTPAFAQFQAQAQAQQDGGKDRRRKNQSLGGGERFQYYHGPR